MVKITYSQKYINVVDDDEGEIFTEHGSCRIPDEEHIEAIVEDLRIGDCKVDYFEYEGMPYISFSNPKQWKVKYYTFNLFTLKPTKSSPIQRQIPKEIAKQLMTKIKYEPPKRTSFKDLMPSKEQITNSLLNGRKDDWGLLCKVQELKTT